MKSPISAFLPTNVALVLLFVLPVAAKPGGLDVRDFGASGSAFETVAETAAGSNRVEVRDAGDFEVGQGVIISKCNVRYERPLVRGPGEPYRESQPMKGQMELRGFDGSGGDWLVFLLDIDGEDPLTFRWSDDLCRTWKGTRVPVSYDWQTLTGGLKVKFNRWEWKPGHFAHFSARTQLVSKIAQIEGNTLILQHAANRSVSDAMVRHCDDQALQTAVNYAIKHKRNLHLPTGHYRLSKSLTVQDAEICIEGASAEHTVMDITDGQGAIFALQGGKEVTLRNFSMVGHTPLAQKPATLRTATNYSFWCCAMKPCNAVSIRGTERVLVENVHARHMASECFFSGGPYRKGKEEPDVYTKSATFLRCSVTNCAANAFNNCDFAEGTTILDCRIDGAGWHAYEGSGRFIKFIGNYVRNAGPVTIGDIPHVLPRLEHAHELGVGQAIVANNVFEGIGRSGGIRVNHCPTQVSITNNLFINYNGTAIATSGRTVLNTFPPRNIVIRDNIIDLTYSGKGARSRAGIVISTSDTTASNNQVYVRGTDSQNTTGIRIHDGAVHVNIHDNLVRNCAAGLSTLRLRGNVTEVVDATAFRHNGIPLQWRDSHLYRGWNIVWFEGASAVATSIIDSYDPDTLQLKLTKRHGMRVGEAFEVYPPSADWIIHDNIITGCLRPVALDSHGSPTSIFRNNMITRGRATGIRGAVVVSGQFSLIGNQIAGFDEADSAALVLRPDASAKSCRSIIRKNIFQDCTHVIKETAKGLWKSSITDGNSVVSFDGVPDTTADTSPEQAITPLVVQRGRRPQLLAPALKAQVNVDGNVAEWPWNPPRRVAAIAQAPDGGSIGEPVGYLCAARDATNLYLAARILVPKGADVRGGTDFPSCDGIEVSFQSTVLKPGAEIFVLWGSTDATFTCLPNGGASPAQIARAHAEVNYVARTAPGEWTCEWQIPFATFGIKPTPGRQLPFNVGVHITARKLWAGWVGTQGAFYEVGNAGELLFTE
ncbi:MAG: hypothetical protein HN742_18980 [Lentisphaerae bacterium]|nr:hypothetical protein [Lentisphaerota bacterium]MBT4823490.1 hypothetical protein [Lentisphaerota bacterium]MBT5610267.1 hypothetical protein [Lentisphaerota bacterium]MBT7060311.1 hypothetical protein [Lentisphaerota bacterium]MBT7843971.1 hypothetical protein [Lentisphaerota bacterium]